MIDVAERVYPYRIGFSTAMNSQFAGPSSSSSNLYLVGGVAFVTVSSSPPT